MSMPQWEFFFSFLAFLRSLFTYCSSLEFSSTISAVLNRSNCLLLVPSPSKQVSKLVAKMQYNFMARMVLLSNTRFHFMQRVRDNRKPGSIDIPFSFTGFESNM